MPKEKLMDGRCAHIAGTGCKCPESTGPCSPHGRMNCVDCYTDDDADDTEFFSDDIDDGFDGEAENEARVTREDNLYRNRCEDGEF